MPLSITKRIRFCAGHRLLGHEGKCAHMHGHEFTLDVSVTADELDDVGRLVDFSAVKAAVKGWIDEHWDHGFLLWSADETALRAVRSVEPVKLFELPGNPTVENLVLYLANEVCPRLLEPLGVRLERLVLWETPDSWAEAIPEGGKPAAGSG